MGHTIKQGQKFALLVFSGLNMNIHDEISDRAELGFGCWSLSNLPFTLDPWWRSQLGNIVSEKLDKHCDFVLLVKQQSKSNDAFGVESQILRNRVLFLMWGLAVTVGVSTFEFGRLIFGAVLEPDRPKIAIAQFARFYQTVDAEKPTADLAALQSAAYFSHHAEEISEARKQESSIYYRLASGIDALVAGFESSKQHVRLHHFVRAIEAFLPASVRGRGEFADYGATFLSKPEEQDTRMMLVQMYDLRSAAEHHRRFDQRALPDVANPEAVAMCRTRQAEAFGRQLYRRFLATEANNLHIFRDEESLQQFWKDKIRIRETWESRSISVAYRDTPDSLYRLRAGTLAISSENSTADR